MESSTINAKVVQNQVIPTIVSHEIIEEEVQSADVIYGFEHIGDYEYEEIDQVQTHHERELEHNEILRSISKKSSNKAYYCPHCGNCYGAAGSLKLHVRACVREKESKSKDLEKRKCKTCGKVYTSISYLKQHQLRHSGKIPRKCDKCNRKFIDDSKYEVHIKSHENDLQIISEGESSHDGKNTKKNITKQYTCSFCHKNFTVVFNTMHIRKRYACDECRERFTNEEELRKHKESLEEKKELKCEICGRIFAFEGFLWRHVPTCDGTIKKTKNISR